MFALFKKIERIRQQSIAPAKFVREGGQTKRGPRKEKVDRSSGKARFQEESTWNSKKTTGLIKSLKKENKLPP